MKYWRFLRDRATGPNGVWLLFSVMFVACFAIFFARFPNNFIFPNFYAEDGTIFAFCVLHYGFLKALFLTFNGYYVSGLYLLTGLGFVVNQLKYGGELVTLPQSLALVSYAFMALIATLPILLLRRYVPMIWLVGLALLVSFVPMPGSDYAVIGTIGNLKFAFLYLGVVLLVYRNYAPARSRGIWWCDLALLLCAYTDITVYILMPFALVRYFPLLSRNVRETLRRLLHDRSFISLLVMVALLLPQLVVIKLFGIPKLPGYLDTPFQPERGVEIFVWRTYLYGFFYAFIKFFKDSYVLIIAGVAALALAFWAKRYRYAYVMTLCIYAAFMGTYLFVANRPGVSTTYYGYKASGPDQFFYAQNLIIYLLVIFALAKLSQRLKPHLRIVSAVAFTAICLVSLRSASTYGANNFMARNAGTAIVDMKTACLHQPGDNVSFTIYPAVTIHYSGPRAQICTKRVQDYVLQREVALGLTPTGTGLVPFPGSTTPFTQTFVSPENQLDGVALFIATYAKTVTSNFTFTLYDASCSQKLAQAPVVGRTLQDNSFRQITFAPQANSAGKTYCFTVKPDSLKGLSPIALRYGAPDAYPAGQTVVSGQALNTDIVFTLLYAEK